jgi:hypothetical protein
MWVGVLQQFGLGRFEWDCWRQSCINSVEVHCGAAQRMPLESSIEGGRWGVCCACGWFVVWRHFAKKFDLVLFVLNHAGQCLAGTYM